MDKKILPTVTSHTIEVNAILKEFMNSLEENVTRTVENATLGIGAMRLCFDDKARMPEWAELQFSLNLGGPLSADQFLDMLCKFDKHATIAMLAPMMILRDVSEKGRDLALAIELDICQRRLEAALKKMRTPKPALRLVFSS